MRIRLPFACSFLLFLLLSAYLGLAPSLGSIPHTNDKVLHLVIFFVLTTAFYWIVDASRRRALNLTLTTCTAVLGVGSEVVQGALPNGRQFDPFDIVANIVGSLVALAICSWYHKRMLERKRKAKYQGLLEGEEGAEDLELGESSREGQESRVTPGPSLEEEVDNWDENAEDAWEEEDGQTGESPDGEVVKTPPSSSTDGEVEGKKRHD